MEKEGGEKGKKRKKKEKQGGGRETNKLGVWGMKDVEIEENTAQKKKKENRRRWKYES